MTLKHLPALAMEAARTCLVSIVVSQLAFGGVLPAAAQSPNARDNDTATPIKHVIVIIGENRSFDHVFATYVPKKGESVMNLLSQGIIKADGTPGRNFSKAEQKAANDQTPDAFLLSPQKSTFQGDVLPAPLVGGPSQAVSYIPSTVPLSNPAVQYTPQQLLALASQTENGLPADYSPLILTGGSLAPSDTPDTRIKGVTNSAPYYSKLHPGPFQLTGPTFSYDYYAASPVHRFYQMWQQLDCDTSNASYSNPSGCDAALFPWVETTIGAGDNGLAQPTNFSTEYSPSAKTTGEGSTSMAFYNVQNGDVPYFKFLADTYSMSDNFHQSVNGGTGANHIMFGHADMLWFSDANGNPAVPPNGRQVFTGTVDAGIVNEVENPNPAPGTRHQ